MTSSSTLVNIWSNIQIEQVKKRNGFTRKIVHPHVLQKSQLHNNNNYKWKIIWPNVIALIILHLSAFYGIHLVYAGYLYGKTILFGFLVCFCVYIGVAIGAHRLWSLQCFKACFSLRVLLAIFQTLSFQNSIYKWVLDYRVHHTFFNTNADPYNSTRGFFFSYLGWFLIQRHKDVFENGRSISMYDVEADPIIMWQKRNYRWLGPLVGILLPTFIPHLFWEEQLWYSFMFVGLTRLVLTIHVTCLFNSAANIWRIQTNNKTKKIIFSMRMLQ
ncbi:acyl-CoA Delta-9 desaturase-like isoform X2 [Daktulosphaira vitifoliae]|uniref:acyl-CoA Delta-9 desaturase-like isoform X2 n=1 Tax=Daktulosphaira vitifoliae TaxID=58002 RepID=UPI0021A9C0C2|nr:acyl-CoA Delta-9 desaturase-like isoform X2 [Daktulosphaira vitifoliae]